jgi:hypothetical protein
LTLSFALSQAKKAHVETVFTADVENLLCTLQREQKYEVEQILMQAMSLGNADTLRKALSQAATAHVELSMIAQAQEKLHDMERRLEVEKALTDAIVGIDATSLKFALQLAETFCVDEVVLAKARDRLRVLRRKDEAETALTEATHIVNSDLLMSMINEAVAAGVADHVVLCARERLEQLKQKQQEAQRRLEDTVVSMRKVSPPTAVSLHLLEVCLEEALAEGVQQSKVREAQDLLAELKLEQERAIRASTDELFEAVPTKDAARIQKCLLACKVFGAERAIAEALAAVASFLCADIEAARGMERENRVDVLPGMEELLGILREHSYSQLRKIHNAMQDLKGVLRVFCRLRPLSKREIQMNDPVAVEVVNQFTVDVTLPRREVDVSESFSYDAVFSETTTQAEIFAECQSLIQSAFDGYNITIMTYGQTGAGKTWTLYGVPEQPGISPRTCDEVFGLIDRDRDKFDFVVKASMVELYNNNVRDLLSVQKVPPKIDIRMSKKDDGSEVVRLDCTELEVASACELNKVVDRGFGQRKVASTIMNADSSRSHLLFMIKLVITDKTTGQVRVGKISIVDLAGSERISKSLVSGDIQKEAIEINKSLTALCDVMSSITSGGKVVPYRNHKLTMLMQDSLGGTAKTLMFVNISPTSFNADESSHTLRYASRARTIENNVTKCDVTSPRFRRNSLSNSLRPRHAHSPRSPRLNSSPSPTPRSPMSSRMLSSPRGSFGTRGSFGGSPRGMHASMSMLSRNSARG